MILFCKQFVTVQSNLQNTTHFGGWRIRQIKFQKQSKKCKHFIPFFEILLGSEQLQYFGLTVCKTKIILIGDEICLKL